MFILNLYTVVFCFVVPTNSLNVKFECNKYIYILTEYDFVCLSFSLGDVSPISMSPISQSQFIPLGEILCLAISAMNSAHKPVTQDALMEHLSTCFPGNPQKNDNISWTFLYNNFFKTSHFKNINIIHCFKCHMTTYTVYNLQQIIQNLMSPKIWMFPIKIHAQP